MVYFEELTAPENRDVFRKLFDHCDIRLPEKMMGSLLNAYSFRRLSKRNLGEENVMSHYRKGTSGDWHNYFDRHISKEFERLAGDLVIRMGYH